MIFPRSLSLALLSAPFAVFAQSPNAFKLPPQGLSAAAGKPLSLSWDPTTQGTVTLVLRSGASSNLDEGTVIASKIDNSGSYTWTPESTITRGSAYTIEIVDDADPSQVNYTPPFVLDSPTTVAYSTSQVSLGASSAAGTSSASQSASESSAAAASATGSASMSASESASASASEASSSATAAATSASESAASAGASMSRAASGSASQASTMATTTSSGASSGASSAASSASVAVQSTGGAPRATAVAGMLGLAALGALAL